MGNVAPRPAVLGSSLLAVLVLVLAGAGRAQAPTEIRERADRTMVQAADQFRAGQHDEALRSLHEALSLYRRLGDRRREGYALTNIGSVSLRAGRATGAQEALTRALAIAREIGDRESEASILPKLAEAHRGAGDAERAATIYRELLARARAEHNRHDEGAALWHLGNLALEAEDYARAADFFAPALVVTQDLGHRALEAAVLSKLGIAYYYLGAYPRAIEVLTRSLSLAQAASDARAQASALRTLGSAHYFRGDWAQATAAFTRDLELARQLGDRGREGRALGNLALVHAAQGDHAQAITFHERGLAISRDVGDRQAEARGLLNLAAAHQARGDADRAIELYRRSLALARAIPYRRGEGIALTNLGLALHRTGRLDDAERALRDAVAVLEGLRERTSDVDAANVSLFETHLRTYRYLQATLVARGQAGAALEVAERGRARALVELMSRRLASPRPASQAPGSDGTRVTAPGLADIQAVARTRGATLVEYAIMPEEAALFVWVVKPDGAVVFRRVDLRGSGVPLDDLVRRVHTVLGIGGRSGTPAAPRPFLHERALRDLHDVLIQPIAGDLPPDPNALVVFVPQDVLLLVPFAALRDPSGHAVVDRHTIAVTPSAQTLDLARAAAARRRGAEILIVGNPTMPRVAGTELRPLPGAEREALAIAQMLGVRALTGDRASKAAVVARLRGARLVHLATHGLLADVRGRGIPGAVALGPSPGDDGLLTSSDILDLDLGAELVVLSACDTGGGDVTGDAVVGLSRAVVSAGVPSLVVSLWSVPDAPTADLMTAFYRHLGRDANRARALRQAMLEVRARNPHPRDWAAFMLIGEADTGVPVLGGTRP